MWLNRLVNARKRREPSPTARRGGRPSITDAQRMVAGRSTRVWVGGMMNRHGMWGGGSKPTTSSLWTVTSGTLFFSTTMPSTLNTPPPTADLDAIAGRLRYRPVESGVTSRPNDSEPSDADRMTRRASRRQYLTLTRVANAAKALESLPENGESTHLIARGHFDAFDLVPAVLRMAAPATIAELNIATLGFNERNAATLLELLDGGIGRVTFICSKYFSGMSDGKPVFEALCRDLGERGHPITSARCHAKILGFELTDGRCIVSESSANLRSCRNIEQFVITHDRDLLEFHRRWMADVLERSER